MKCTKTNCINLILVSLAASQKALAFQPNLPFASNGAGGRCKVRRRDQGIFSLTGVIKRTRGGAAPPVLSTTSLAIQEDFPGVNGTGDFIPRDTHLTNNPKIETSSEVLTARGGAVQRLPWWRYLIPSKEMIPELMGEAFGTFILLQLALGVVVSAVITGSMEGVFPIAVLTGMAITAAVAAVSSKCAAHFNPAITWAMCLYRKFGWSKLVPYSVSQVLGATVAALVNYGMYSSHIRQYEATHGIVRASMEGLATAKASACFYSAPLVTPVAAFLAETFGTFVLASTIFALTSEKNDQVKGLFIPPIIGGTVALIIAIVGPVSCASLNPAREIGPRLILKAFGWSSVAFHQLGLYLAAPILGATLGGLFVDKFLYDNKPVPSGTDNYSKVNGKYSAGYKKGEWSEKYL